MQQKRPAGDQWSTAAGHHETQKPANGHGPTTLCLSREGIGRRERCSQGQKVPATVDAKAGTHRKAPTNCGRKQQYL
jgi:hypothetical protein